MPKSWAGEERRRHPRVSVQSRERGGAESVLEDAVVVDVSLSGALLEVSSTLPSNSRYVLTLPRGEGDALQIPGEVVRSYVHGFQQDRGQPTVRYRAAIQFVELTPEMRGALEQLVGGSGEEAAPSGSGTKA